MPLRIVYLPPGYRLAIVHIYEGTGATLRYSDWPVAELYPKWEKHLLVRT